MAGYTSEFAQEIQSQRFASLTLHREKYNPENIQCLYEGKKQLCMQCRGEKLERQVVDLELF